MLGTSPGDQVIVDHTTMASAVSGRPRADNKGRYTFGCQSLSATYRKIHINDNNLTRLENVPEQINSGNSMGPLTLWAGAER
jgi:hypothetical protein